MKKLVLRTLNAVQRSVSTSLAGTSALAVVLATSLLGPAKAEGLSTSPITIVVGYQPGGSLDRVARIVAPALSKELKTSMIVENKPGASGLIASDYVSKAKPDGHTLLVGSVSPIVLSPQAIPSSNFDSNTDLTAINTAALSPQVIAVSPKVGVKTLRAFLERAQKTPSSFASTGIGSLPHLTIEMLSDLAGSNILHVPYQGVGPAVTDTIAGRVDGIVLDVAALQTYIQSGQLVALATTSESPVELLPGVPQANDVLPGFSVMNWIGLFAPKNLPAEIREELNTALTKAIASPEVGEQLKSSSLVPSTMASTGDVAAFVRREHDRWGKLLREKNVQIHN